MLGFFPKSTVVIEGKSNEQWSLTRASKSRTTSSVNSQYQALVPKDTVATKGDIATIDSEKYFVTAIEKSFVNIVAKLYKANCTVSIAEIKKHFTSGVNDYLYESPVVTSIPAYFEEVTAKMQQWDQGLLATTTTRFLVSDDIAVKATYRIKNGTENTMVNGVNTSNFPGLLWVQCTVDNRVTK